MSSFSEALAGWPPAPPTKNRALRPEVLPINLPDGYGRVMVKGGWPNIQKVAVKPDLYIELHLNHPCYHRSLKKEVRFDEQPVVHYY